MQIDFNAQPENAFSSIVVSFESGANVTHDSDEQEKLSL
jgi:hypothetical protein